MSIDSTHTQSDKKELTRRKLVTGRFVSIYTIENTTNETITTPFSDYPCRVLVVGGDSKITQINGTVKSTLARLRVLSSTQFYAIELRPNEKITMVHGRLKKSAGDLVGDIQSNQSHYTYTYTHPNDPHTRAEGRAPIEEEDIDKCVI